MAKVVLRVRIVGIGNQRLQQRLGVENVNAHRGINGAGVERRADAGRGRLFLKAQHFSALGHFHHPESRNFIGRNRQRCQRHLRIGVPVVRQHPAIVHLVDVIAGKNDYMLRLLAADRVNILIHSVGRPHVPVGSGPLHGRHQLEKLAQLLGHNSRPAFADVPVQAQRLVLRQHINPAQSRIDAVGKRDIDNAVMPAKGHRRFGPVPGEWKKTFSCSAGEQYSNCVFHVHCTPLWLLFPTPRLPLKSATIRNSIFSGDTFPQAPSNAGEYHMQANLAAHVALSMMLYRRWLASISRPGDSGVDRLPLLAA